MKIVRFGSPNQERVGLIDGQGQRRDASKLVPEIDHKQLLQGAIAKLEAVEAESLPLVNESERWGAPIARPGKVVCIGLNYADHAAEAGMPVPSEPVLFFKAPNTVIGPYDDIEIPRGSQKTDWEVELGVVIGKTARYLDVAEDALEYVAGYTISHDVSEREFQLERGGQWVKGKSCDTFNPLGPWLVTPDEVPDPQNLSMTLKLNDAVVQRGSTKTMIFSVAHVIHYISQFMTLEAGDLLTTGTPPGVGMSMTPPRYLQPGDRVDLAIEGLGQQQQHCRPAR